MIELIGKIITDDFFITYEFNKRGAYKGEVFNQQDNKKYGFSVSIDKKSILVSYILFSNNIKDFNEYNGILPFGLTWLESIDSIITKLGEPQSISPVKNNPIIGKTDKFYVYKKDGLKYALTFSDDDKLIAITCSLCSIFG